MNEKQKKWLIRTNKILNFALFIIALAWIVGWYFTPKQDELAQQASIEFEAAAKMFQQK